MLNWAELRKLGLVVCAVGVDFECLKRYFFSSKFVLKYLQSGQIIKRNTDSMYCIYRADTKAFQKLQCNSDRNNDMWFIQPSLVY